jgi:hypothetical protein
VYRPTLYPAASRIASSIAQVEPLPLVPATVKTAAALDLPRTSRTLATRSSPSWMDFGWMRSM